MGLLNSHLNPIRTQYWHNVVPQDHSPTADVSGVVATTCPETNAISTICLKLLVNLSRYLKYLKGQKILFVEEYSW